MSINILIKAVMRFYFCFTFLERVGFPGSSASKESTCNAGRKIRRRRDQLPTPVFLGFPGGSAGESPPATRETWVQSLCWEDPREMGMATHSSILAWRIPWNV